MAEKIFDGGFFMEYEIEFLESQYANYRGCIECFKTRIRPELKKLHEAPEKQAHEEEADLKKFCEFYNSFVCPHSEETHFENPTSEENGYDWVPCFIFQQKKKALKRKRKIMNVCNKENK